MTDLAALALTILYEAGNEPIESKIGVAMVVRNRVLTDIHNDQKPDWWGEGYVGVCHARRQFSCWDDHAHAMAQDAARIRDTHDTRLLDPPLQLCLEIARATITSKLADNTFNSRHYYAARIPVPSWAVGKIPVIQLGQHLFYNDIT